MKTETSNKSLENLFEDTTGKKHDAIAVQIDAIVKNAGMSIAYVLVTHEGIIERVVSHADPLKLLGGVTALMYTLAKDSTEGAEDKS